MVAVGGKVASFPPRVDYDYHADVLYVSLDHHVSDEGEDHPKGIVLRFAVKDNHPSGVTVIGFRKNHWIDRLRELSQIIANHLGVDDTYVAQAIERATVPTS